MKSFRQLMEERIIHQAGAHVVYRHGEHYVSGVVVGATHNNKGELHYHVNHGFGEPEKTRKVPAHKVEKYHGLDETVDNKFQRAHKDDLNYSGQINGKTYVVPHSFPGVTDKNNPMRHAIVVSPVHVQHNNPTLTPEESARVHAHIKDIHGGQDPARLGNLDEGVTGPTRMQLQNHFNAEKGTVRQRLDATEKAHKVSNIQTNSKGEIVNYKIHEQKEDTMLNEELHAYNVHHKGKHIDTVFYGSHRDPVDVKKSLVNHDNYHPDIVVTKERKALATKKLEEGRKSFNVFTKHQTNIAKKTLRMPDAMVGVMGGPNKEESRKHLKSQGWSDEQIHKHENLEETKKYDIFHKGKYHVSTEQSKSAQEATEKYLKAYPEHKRENVRAFRDTKHGHLKESHMKEAPPFHGKENTFDPGTSVPAILRHHLQRIHDYSASSNRSEASRRAQLWHKREHARLVASLLKERILTPSEDAKKEEIVHSMKHKIQGFKERYGKRAKEVMYATATARAKKLEENNMSTIHEEPKKIQEWDSPYPSDVAFQAKKRHDAEQEKGSLADRSANRQHFGHCASCRKLGTVSSHSEKCASCSPQKESRTFSVVKSIIAETMTRKHFQQVADVIKAHPDAAKRSELAHHHAQIFAKSNPRFDHKRFYAAANAGEPLKEQVEQIEELKKSTLASYTKKAARELGIHSYMSASNKAQADNLKIAGSRQLFQKMASSSEKISKKREAGIVRAAGKLAKEEVEALDEAMDPKKFMTTYRRNESQNRHTENLHHLATHYGTEEHRAMTTAALAFRKKHGHGIGGAEREELYHKVHVPLYAKAHEAYKKAGGKD